MVDLVGIEPTTSSMPWKRAPSCATGPLLGISGLWAGAQSLTIFAHPLPIVKLDAGTVVTGCPRFYGFHQGFLPCFASLQRSDIVPVNNAVPGSQIRGHGPAGGRVSCCPNIVSADGRSPRPARAGALGCDGSRSRRTCDRNRHYSPDEPRYHSGGKSGTAGGGSQEGDSPGGQSHSVSQRSDYRRAR